MPGEGAGDMVTSGFTLTTLISLFHTGLRTPKLNLILPAPSPTCVLGCEDSIS